MTARVLAVGANDQVMLVDAATGKVAGKWRAHLAKLDALAFSPDGGRLVSTGLDDTAAVWSLRAN